MEEVSVPTLDPHDVLIRIAAAGVCHSDAHYRAGISEVKPLPLTLGHEVAGTITEVGAQVRTITRGDRVCVHYLVTCGECPFCRAGQEQFCRQGKMIGKHRDGGYADLIVVPERNVFRLPDEIPFDQGAILMCSTATSFHALKKALLAQNETVAIFGIGGLGVSAVQLAKQLGASAVFAVDINPHKLGFAEKFGAIPINASLGNPVSRILELTSGRGVDVAVELVGLPGTMRQAVQSLAPLGRAAIVGLTQETFEVAPYAELLNKEAQIIGISDHLRSEIPTILELVRTGQLDLSHGVIRTISLDAAAVNRTLDELSSFGDDVRVVITPSGGG